MTETGRAMTPSTASGSTGVHKTDCVTGMETNPISPRRNSVITITTTTTIMIGGSTIVLLSFWSAAATGAGGTAGGILPGATIPITPITNTMVLSIVTTDLPQMRSSPMCKQNYNDSDTTTTRLMASSGHQPRMLFADIKEIVSFRLRDRSIQIQSKPSV